jgi:hypothetical protein
MHCNGACFLRKKLAEAGSPAQGTELKIKWNQQLFCGLHDALKPTVASIHLYFSQASAKAIHGPLRTILHPPLG